VKLFFERLQKKKRKMDRPFARVTRSRFGVVAEAYAEVRAAHISRETAAEHELAELSARLARLEALVCELRARLVRKKVGA
jgi:hypothetical protein